MRYFSRRNQIAFFLLIFLLIAPSFGVVAAADDTLRINGKIAFTSERDGNREIYTMNDDGSGQTRLTKNNYGDEFPSWSPDGTQIAFNSNRDGNYEIYTMNADGSGQTRLTNNNADDHDGSWSPDGAKITFSSNRDGNYEIYTMNADGSGQTRLTNNNAWDYYPKWSPDGAKIAFTSDRDGNWEIYVMNADGSKQTRLTNNNYSDGECFWSPDGAKIAFSSDRDGYAKNYVMKADGSGQTRLANNNAPEGGDGSWSPDGAKIAFNSNRDGNWEICVMNSDGSVQTRLTNNSADDYWPSWQSVYLVKFKQAGPRINGKIAFQSDRDGNFEIYVMNADGSQQTNLSNNNSYEGAPSWSPDGSKIAFASDRDGDLEIYTMNSDGSGQTRLTNNNDEDNYPDWSPDGTKIAFDSNRDGNYEIYIMYADGSNQTRVTHSSDHYDVFPHWSPDGTKITYDSYRGDPAEIYVMNADGSMDTNLTNNHNNDACNNWSPDGSKIVFNSNRDGNWEIYVMNSDGSGQTRLTNTNYGHEGPSWSPDGTKIAYNTDRDKRDDDPPGYAEGNLEIYIINADGSGQTRLTNNVATDKIPDWQSRTLATATLTLQSSTTNTMVDTPFNLNAILSVPKSGTITLYWSINGSGFIYRHNETMTNSRFDRVFEASSPGIWAFKVVWAGDDEYKSADSNNITVTIKSIPALAAVAKASPATVYSGGASTIRASLTSGGAAVTGATVNFASSNGGTFSTITDQGNGTYLATYTAPDVVAQTVSTVTVSASKSGYLGVSGQTQVTVQPLVISIYVKASDGAPISGAAVTSTSQPSGQTALSGNTDASGQLIFINVQKGDYAFKATKSGYDDKTWTLKVQQGQAATETITLVKTSGIPGYPNLSIALALLLAMIISYWGKHRIAG